MRISDWSSDVCSSDLAYIETFQNWLRQHGVEIVIARYIPVRAPYDSLEGELRTNNILPGVALGRSSCSIKWKQEALHQYIAGVPANGARPAQPGWKPALDAWARSEERSVGEESVSRGNSRW